jgi:hypothetical protein
VLASARAGRATVVDSKKGNLVMLPESRLDALEGLAHWSAEQLRLSRLVERDEAPTVAQLGGLAWLRVFDLADLRLFSSELHDVLIAALADGTTEVVERCVDDWKTTARQLEDPLRRSILLGMPADEDFDEVERI